nr:putative phage tail protein [Aneurinibacillus sp. XH2]
MSKPIMKYWITDLDKIRDFRELAKTEDIELKLLEGAINQLFDDQFVMTSGPDAIRRREKMLGIQADPTTESLEFRKKRILNRYQIKPPFTIRYLQQQLDSLLGKGRALTSVDVQNFILTVTTSLDDANLFKEMERTIKTVKPANLIYQQQTAVQDEVIIVEHISKKDIAWNYKLNGTWRLGEKPFSTLGQEVVIK